MNVDEALKDWYAIADQIGISKEEIKEKFLAIFEDKAYKASLEQMGGLESDEAIAAALDVLGLKISAMLQNPRVDIDILVLDKQLYNKPVFKELTSEEEIKKNNGKKFVKTGDDKKISIMGIDKEKTIVLLVGDATEDMEDLYLDIEVGKCIRVSAQEWSGNDERGFIGMNLNENTAIAEIDDIGVIVEDAREVVKALYREVKVTETDDETVYSEAGEMVVMDVIIQSINEKNGFVFGYGGAVGLTPQEIINPEIPKSINLSFRSPSAIEQIPPGSKVTLIGTLGIRQYTDADGQVVQYPQFRVRDWIILLKPEIEEEDVDDDTKSLRDYLKKKEEATKEQIEKSGDDTKKWQELCVDFGMQDPDDRGCKRCKESTPELYEACTKASNE